MLLYFKSLRTLAISIIVLCCSIGGLLLIQYKSTNKDSNLLIKLDNIIPSNLKSFYHINRTINNDLETELHKALKSLTSVNTYNISALNNIYIVARDSGYNKIIKICKNTINKLKYISYNDFITNPEIFYTQTSMYGRKNKS